MGRFARIKKLCWERQRGERGGEHQLAKGLAKVNPAPGTFPFAFLPQTRAGSQNQEQPGEGVGGLPCSLGEEVKFKDGGGKVCLLP